jgi:hypothetical protein
MLMGLYVHALQWGWVFEGLPITHNVQQVQLEKSTVLPFKEDHRQDIDDMITMSEAHEAPLLYNLKRRYDKDKIYVCVLVFLRLVFFFQPKGRYDNSPPFLDKYRPCCNIRQSFQRP